MKISPVTIAIVSAFLSGAALVGVIVFLFIKRKLKSAGISQSQKIKLASTLFMLEGDQNEVPLSDNELLERLDSIARNLQGRYDVLINNLAAGVLVYDEDRTIRFVSPYTEVLTGYPISDFYEAPQDLFESIAVDHDGEKYARAKQISHLGENFQLQYQIRHRSGLRIWLDTRFVPIFDNKDQVVGLLCVTLDVTESIKQRHLLEQQNQDLSDFSYMVSHDLKAPIFTIKGMVGAIGEDYGDKLGEDGLELLKFIEDGAKRLESLVASVIEYSAVTVKEGERKPVETDEVLASVVKDFREQIRLAEAEIILPTNLPTVHGDPIRYYQVFANLIGNAIKYRSPKRKLRIELSVREHTHELVAVDITDNGLGIPQGKVKDVFRPYHRAHSSDIEGSGIGLASVKKIVERVGGQVSVTSVEDEGSTFRVLLPVAKPQVQIEDRLSHGVHT
jgi:PAS domain S-box-containing protein